MMNEWQVPETDQERLDVLRKIVHVGSCDFACSRFLLQTETLHAAKSQLQKYAHVLRVLCLAEGRNRSAREMFVHSVAHLERRVRECYACLPAQPVRSRSTLCAGMESTASRYEQWVEAAEKLLLEDSMPRNTCRQHHIAPWGECGGPSSERLHMLEQAVHMARQAHANLTVTAETVQMVDASSVTIRLETDALLHTAYRELCTTLYQRPVARQREILAEYGLLSSRPNALPQPTHNLLR